MTNNTETEPATGQPLVPDQTSPASAQDKAASDDCEEPTKMAHLDIILQPFDPS